MQGWVAYTTIEKRFRGLNIRIDTCAVPDMATCKRGVVVNHPESYRLSFACTGRVHSLKNRAMNTLWLHRNESHPWLDYEYSSH